MSWSSRNASKDSTRTDDAGDSGIRESPSDRLGEGEGGGAGIIRPRHAAQTTRIGERWGIARSRRGFRNQHNESSNLSTNPTSATDPRSAGVEILDLGRLDHPARP